MMDGWRGNTYRYHTLSTPRVWAHQMIDQHRALAHTWPVSVHADTALMRTRRRSQHSTGPPHAPVGVWGGILVCVYVLRRVWVCMCLGVYVLGCVLVGVRLCVCVRLGVCVCVCVWMYVCMYVCQGVKRGVSKCVCLGVFVCVKQEGRQSCIKHAHRNELKHMDVPHPVPT